MRTHWLLLTLVAVARAADAQSIAYEFGASAAANDSFAQSVRDAGDVDADGFTDIVIGVPYDDALGLNSGAAEVYSGRTGALVRAWSGQADEDSFGWTVDGLGDIDGDGHSDVVVGAPFRTVASLVKAGQVYLLSGATGQVLRTHSGAAANFYYGHVVRGLGDIDGDGVGDYAVGVPFYDAGSSIDRGRVELRNGATGALLALFDGSSKSDWLGRSIDVVRAGPTQFESRIVIGSPGWGANNAGRVVVINGFGSAVTNLYGTWDGGDLGYGVAGLGDVNGDGVPDFAASEPFADIAGADTGRVNVYSGATFGLVRSVDGTSPGESFGEKLSRIGDWNGDGRADVLVGAPNTDIGTAYQGGRATVVSGASGGVLASWSGAQLNDNLGRSVAAADLNGDGVLDALVGAPGVPPGGRAYACLARAPLPSTYCTAKTNSIGCTPSIASVGAASLSIADSFRVTAANVINQKNGFLYWGLAATATPFWDATMCVALPRTRTPPQSSGGNAAGFDCSGAYSFHFSHAYLASFAISAGTTLYAQYWSRDPYLAAPNNFGLTAGLALVTVP